MEKIRVYMDDPETGQRKYGSVTVDKLSVALAKGFKVAEQQAAAPPAAASAPSPAAPAAPAAPMAAEAPAAPAEPETTAGGLLGAFARGAAPIAGGAALGGLMAAPSGVGIPFGMAAGAGTAALTQLVADPAMGLINWAAGTDYPMPSKAFEDMLTELGVPEPKTAAERLVQQATAGAAGAVGGAGLARTIATPAAGAVSGAETLAQRIAAQAAKQPGAQAFAGGAAGLAGQAAAEEGVGPGGQALAALAGGVAGGALTQARTPQALREAQIRSLEKKGAGADVARVKTAGPKAVELAEATGGAGVKETARVMRESGMGGIMSPQALSARAGTVIEETNALIGRIVQEVDQQGANMMRQADELRASLDPAKVKAAEDAARNADEIEASLAAAEKRLLDEKREVFSTSTSSGVRPPAKGIKEPGVTRVNDADLQRRAKEAADDAAAKVAAAKDAMNAAQRQEKLTTKGSFAPDPLTGETALAPSGRDPLMFKAMLLQNEAEMATARANQLAEEARLGAASAEEPMGMREVVSANKTLQSRQRELDMMRAAAKKAREDAVRLSDDAGITAVNAKAEQLTADAGKRKVSGKAVADRIRSEMRQILTKQTPNTMNPDDVPSETLRNQYRFLEKAAERLDRGGDLTLRQTYDRLMPIEDEAGYGRKQSAKKQARSETAKTQSRAIREGMDAPIEEGIPAEGGMSDVTMSPYARIGRGEPVAGPVSGKEAYGSFRRAGAVARDVAEATAAELEAIDKATGPVELFGTKIPMTAGVKAAFKKRLPTGFEATRMEMAQEKAQTMRQRTPEELALERGIPASFLEALRQIDEEAAQ